MEDTEKTATVDLPTWIAAERGARMAAAPARLVGRLWGIAAFVVIAAPVVAVSDGVYRITNLLYAAVVALGVGVWAHSRTIRRDRSAALAAVLGSVVPDLVPRITEEELAMLVLTHGVWIGRVYLLAEVGETAVRLVRPPHPSPEEYPGFVLGLSGPIG